MHSFICERLFQYHGFLPFDLFYNTTQHKSPAFLIIFNQCSSDYWLSFIHTEKTPWPIWRHHRRTNQRSMWHLHSCVYGCGGKNLGKLSKLSCTHPDTFSRSWFSSAGLCAMHMETMLRAACQWHPTWEVISQSHSHTDPVYILIKAWGHNIQMEYYIWIKYWLK